MAETRDIQGTVFKNGSATLLARVVGPDGHPIQQAHIASVTYTVYVVDPLDPDSDTPVEGHKSIGVPGELLIFDVPQRDPLWDVDATGYNFKHVLDVSTWPAFAVAGRTYRIVFELTPHTGQVILVRFRVYAI